MDGMEGEGTHGEGRLHCLVTRSEEGEPGD